MKDCAMKYHKVIAEFPLQQDSNPGPDPKSGALITRPLLYTGITDKRGEGMYLTTTIY